MYRPQFNGREQAALMLDILRSTTDCDMETCKRAAVLITRQLAVTVNSPEDLSEIGTYIDEDDIVDVDSCFDAKTFDEQVELLRMVVIQRSGPGRISYDSSEDVYLCEQMDTAVDILTKADKHVVEHKLNSKFEFVDDIIRIYQLSQSSSLQANVLKCLSALAKVSKRINVYLLSTNFVSEVVLNTDLTQLVFLTAKKRLANHYMIT
ncbi:hypothetical protein QR680_003478 [Steinernema hermaphroditum]|uniref:Uncharacterized protein n=1 Tax=Steinernema hermaphroditum TaxID=289476 RepID=A0AA39H7W9_9BILA|nr:hypothetical protein QR680_003478 [Steinernema hermaphroditum]